MKDKKKKAKKEVKLDSNKFADYGLFMKAKKEAEAKKE